MNAKRTAIILSLAVLVFPTVTAAQQRYSWATDDACWARIAGDDHALLAAHPGQRPDPQIHERYLHRQYELCLQERANRPRELAVAQITALLDRGDEQGLAQVLQRACARTDDTPRSVVLDGRVQVACDKLNYCLAAQVKYIGGRAACQAESDTNKKLRCLDSLLSTRMDAALSAYQDAECGFRNERVRQAISDDAREKASLETESAYAAAQQRQREELRTYEVREATERASRDPRYLQAKSASEVCRYLRMSQQLATMEKQTREVDRRSGTVNLAQRRELAEAQIHAEQERAKNEQAFVGASGRLPPSARQGQTFWCSFSPDHVLQQLIAQQSASQAGASPPPLSSPQVGKVDAGVTCGSEPWKPFARAVERFCRKAKGDTARYCDGLPKLFAACTSGDLKAVPIASEQSSSDSFTYHIDDGENAATWNLHFSRSGDTWVVDSLTGDFRGNEAE